MLNAIWLKLRSLYWYIPRELTHVGYNPSVS